MAGLTKIGTENEIAPGIFKGRRMLLAEDIEINRENALLSLKSGMNDHVGKPLNIKEVIGKLKQYLPSAL